MWVEAIVETESGSESGEAESLDMSITLHSSLCYEERKRCNGGKVKKGIVKTANVVMVNIRFRNAYEWVGGIMNGIVIASQVIISARDPVQRTQV